MSGGFPPPHFIAFAVLLETPQPEMPNSPSVRQFLSTGFGELPPPLLRYPSGFAFPRLFGSTGCGRKYPPFDCWKTAKTIRRYVSAAPCRAYTAIGKLSRTAFSAIRLLHFANKYRFVSAIDVAVSDQGASPLGVPWGWTCPRYFCARSFLFRAIVNNKQCETRGLFMSPVIHNWMEMYKVYPPPKWPILCWVGLS